MLASFGRWEEERVGRRAGDGKLPSDAIVLQLLMLAMAGLPIALTAIGWAVGFPPLSVTRPAFFAGAIAGALGFAALLLRGWRTERIWYPFVSGAAVLAGVMVAIAVASLWRAAAE